MQQARLNKTLKITFTAALILLFTAATLPSALASQTEAATTIASAKNQINTCFQAAKDAEGAGADITSLLNILNDAGTLLSRAELAYSMNSFDSACDLAQQSQEKLTTVVSEATSLKEIALQQGNLDFMINVVGSTVGTFVVIGLGAAVWLLVKKKYGEPGE